MKNNKGLLIVLSAPGGGGKGAITKGYIQKHPDTEISISCTTRAPRQDDIQDVTYHFVSKDQFDGMIKDGDLFEYEEFCGNYYGTPKKFIVDSLVNNKDVILDIEYKGALNVKSQFPEAILIYILPPSLEVLRERLESRGTDTPERIAERLEKAKEEVEFASKYDYLIINDNLDDAVSKIESIIDAESCKINSNISFIKKFF